MNKKVLMIGGPGKIGSGTLIKLKQQNYDVAIFKRLPEPDNLLLKDVSVYYGNRDSISDLENCINKFNPDIIIDFVCFTPNQANDIIAVLKGRISQFIFVSTVDVYGYPLSALPMSESDIWKKTNSTYAENKLQCEKIFRNSYDQGNIPLVVARPAYSMANEFVLTAFSREGGKYLIPRLRSGKAILVPGDGTTLMHVGVAKNTGSMIARMIGVDMTIGKSYNCAHHSFLSHDDYIKLFSDALKVKPNIVHIPTDLLFSLNSPEVSESILEDLTRHNIAFSNDTFLSDFPDFVWEISLEQAVQEYIKFNDENNLFATVDEIIYEDRLIEVFQKLSREFQNNLKIYQNEKQK